ncbi:fatty acyl-CoA reductase [Halomonadaceae bacterium KBTZ08]
MESQQRNAETNESNVLRELPGKRVLITGVTGFVGKVVLEKLIRQVPDIGAVTLLIRGNRRHGTAAERFAGDVATASVFDRLRVDDPERLDNFLDGRVQCVTGEITEPFFGMTEARFRELAAETDAVINVAASVDFREPLDRALAINALSLRNITELVQEAGDIPLVQVSTCYVNGFNRGHRHEELVTPAGRGIARDPDGTCRVEDLIVTLQDRIADLRSLYSGQKLEEELVNLGIREANRLGWNDTYTLTKWIGEQILARNLRGGSVTILRPSIVESTHEEPVPGWVEGVKVADAVIMAYARGNVMFFPGRRKGVIDVIPADLVANGIIMSLAEQLQAPGRLRIYQCCSGSTNPLRLDEFIDHVMTEAQENHQAYDHLFYHKPKLPFVAVNRRLFDTVSRGVGIPVNAVRRGLQWLGRDAELKTVEHFQTTMKLATTFGFYSCPDYTFHNDRLLEMAQRMGDEDRRLFPVDARRINWRQYIRGVHLAGLNQYALKERKLYRMKRRGNRQRVA